MATRASDFLGTIGINTRLSYVDGDYANATNVLASLQYLGIGHVRDSGVWDRWVGQSGYDKLATAGIRFDMVIQTNRSPDDFIEQVAAFALRHPGAVSSIEGPNEINLLPPTYNGLTGVAAGQAIVDRMGALADASVSLGQTKLFDLTGARVASAAELQNVHLYSRNGSQPSAMIDQAVATRAALAPDKPLVITEIGYHTGVGNLSWEGVDELTQAKLTLNLLLDAEQQGVSQTYLFQLFDAYIDPVGTGIDRNMGLFDHGFAPKLAAVALHNLTTILADYGPGSNSFELSNFDYDVGNLPVTGESLLFEKSNGAFDIVIWAEPDIWDQDNDRPIAIAPTASTVAFGGLRYDVRLFDPLVSDQPIATYTDVTSVIVSVTDHPIIIEVTAVGSPKEDLAAAASKLVITRSGTSAADTMTGGAFDDILKGLAGADLLTGGGGDDQLFGGGGNDRLLGGLGNDLLTGGLGRDIMSGGGGVDIFKFAKPDSNGSTAAKIDTILDWSVDDLLDLPISGNAANYFEGSASDFAAAMHLANAQFNGTVKLAGIAVGADVYLFAEMNANHAGFDFAVALQQTQLAEIGWGNII